MKKLLLLIFILNLSCSINDSKVIETFWIDSKRVSCIDVDERTCYRIQENTIINENDWLLFYDAIEGFKELYEEGYLYKINVTTININNPPADGSSKKYVLKNIISKIIDE